MQLSRKDSHKAKVEGFDDMNMANQRRIQRQQLPYYLNVFNRFTDRPLGFIGNLSEGGLMLISPYPMMLGVRFEMRLKIPGKAGSCVMWISVRSVSGATRMSRRAATTPAFR